MQRHFTYEKISLFFPSARIVQQNRSHEDFLVSYRFGPCELHCVFDGHGGGNNTNQELSSKHVGLYLEKYLIQHLLYHLNGIGYDDESAIRAAVVKCFEEVDHHLHKSGAESGSTCALTLILPETVIVCNLGDSQVYGFRNGAIKFATTPHVAVAEIERIKRDGGHVTNGRLNGIYLPSRSFGDFRAKLRAGKYVSPAPMGIVPDVTFLNRSDYDFFLLMSDGIVDGFLNSSIVPLVREAKNLEEIPKRLAAVAAKNNGNDDICCLLCKM